jgi:hypothetical protein
MARRKQVQHGDLFNEIKGEAPVGLRETCAGCGSSIDMRRSDWVILGDHSIVHQGEFCWRLAVAAEVAAMSIPLLRRAS